MWSCVFETGYENIVQKDIEYEAVKYGSTNNIVAL